MQSTILNVLTPDQRAVLQAIQSTAQREGVPAYLVGGAVRDWLLGRPVGDLDVSVEGDAIAFARALQSEHGGDLQVYEKFRTTTWHSHGLHTDVATSRAETYSRPAVLPAVTPAPIEQDLQRRDFTINAMALRLADDALLDPFDGQADLQRGLVRALHARSFVDDPTRMLRAARYAARFGFAVEPGTLEWIAAGLPHFADLSGERVRYDLELIFDLPQPERALALLSGWGVFKSAGIAVPEDVALSARFEQARAKLMASEWDMDSLALGRADAARAAGWGGLIYNAGQMSASRWVGWVPFPSDLRDALVSLGVLSSLPSELFQGQPSRQSELLRPFEGLALFLGWLFDSSPRKQQAMWMEWHTWRRVHIATTGDDLRALGLPPGPAYRRLLARLRDAWLDGEVHSPEEERALLQRLISL
jgi:tRNA nucleotidyltransferase (CCA-adding enzyme)